MSKLPSFLTRKRMIVAGVFALGLTAFVSASEGTPSPDAKPGPAPQIPSMFQVFNPYTLRSISATPKRIKPGRRRGHGHGHGHGHPPIPSRPPKASPTL